MLQAPSPSVTLTVLKLLFALVVMAALYSAMKASGSQRWEDDE